MSSLRIRVIDTGNLPPDGILRAYLTGYDQQPQPSEMTWDDPILEVRWESSSSVYLHIPWYVSDGPEIMLSTATVRPRAEPYLLSLEVARGTLGRAKSWLADWQRSRLEVPHSLALQLSLASRAFAIAAIRQHDGAIASLDACLSIDFAHSVTRDLGREYTRRVLEYVHRQHPQSLAVTGCQCGGHNAQPFPAAEAELLGAMAVPIVWSRVDRDGTDFVWDESDRRLFHSTSREQRVFGGPLLTFSPDTIPADLQPGPKSLGGFLDRLERFICAAVSRYGDRIHMWHAAAGLNRADAFGIDPEQRLQMTAFAVEILRREAASADVFFSVDQPWGEYLTTRSKELNPLTFAEAIVRAGLGVSAVGLRIVFGKSPQSTCYRDALAVLKLIDRWASLRLPLIVFLSVEPFDGRSDDGLSGNPRDALIAEIARDVIPLLASQRSVMAIIWDHLSMDTGHEIVPPEVFHSFAEVRGR